MSFVVYLLGDALPKTIAKMIPDTISFGVAYIIYGLTWFFTYIIPLTLLFELLIKVGEKIFKVKKEEEFTEEDFENIVEKPGHDQAAAPEFALPDIVPFAGTFQLYGHAQVGNLCFVL